MEVPVRYKCMYWLDPTSAYMQSWGTSGMDETLLSTFCNLWPSVLKGRFSALGCILGSKQLADPDSVPIKLASCPPHPIFKLHAQPMLQKTVARVSNLSLLLLNEGVKLGMEVDWQRETPYQYLEFQRWGSNGQRNILLKICFAHLA